MRKLLSSILTLLMILVFLPFTAAENIDVTEQPVVTARSAVLLDQVTGRILFSKNAHEVLPMASTTKIMTAILALESGRLGEIVKVSEYASLVEGSGIDLEADEEKTLEELVYGLLLQSGNDAATAIAEHLGGSVEKFAVMMTRRAKELGAAQTKFMNPHGLHHEEHFTTAYDLALIAAHAMSIPKFQEVCTTKEMNISWTGRPYNRLLRNQNKLLTLFEGADGIKTGWTTPAGRCFAGSATRDDWRLITVVLNSPQMWEDTIRLLDFGYSYYQWNEVISENQSLKTAAVRKGMSDKVTLIAGKSAGMPLKENEAELLRYHFEVKEPLNAPIKAGQEVGTLYVYFGTQRIATVQLLAGEEVEKRGLGRIIRRFFGGWLQAVAA